MKYGCRGDLRKGGAAAGAGTLLMGKIIETELNCNDADASKKEATQGRVELTGKLWRELTARCSSSSTAPGGGDHVAVTAPEVGVAGAERFQTARPAGVGAGSESPLKLQDPDVHRVARQRHGLEVGLEEGGRAAGSDLDDAGALAHEVHVVEARAVHPDEHVRLPRHLDVRLQPLAAEDPREALGAA
eukprot:CAMPEP_0113708436 /NCGR_PEP_ID=MMETSP0038_2-20120614/28972_1 /TAXON_ID=2898 /ORGANISM="Cryptomonas paramecium" /LENGTH=187 /DNA_ID=CAMNT_0000634125 /DNA_START=173 /DNA_END=732 /DNA_ORIENTATION=+ /assembly_acc=CAM_ASM_000170